MRSGLCHGGGNDRFGGGQMNHAIAALFGSLIMVIGIFGYSTLEKRTDTQAKKDHASCVQRNEGRQATRHILTRQVYNYAHTPDLQNASALRQQIRDDLAKVQPLVC